MTPRTTPVIAVAAMLTLAACSAAVQSEAPTGPNASGTTGTASTETGTTETTVATTVPPATTTTVPPLDVYDPLCVVKVAPGESLSLIADRFDDDTVRVDTLRAENDLPDNLIKPDQLLDVCVDNGLDDRTGDAREPNAVLVEEATRANVEIQQAKLNELFAGTGMAELKIDGVSGAVTRQRLCAARLALGLTPSTTNMAADSEEQQVLLAATTLPIPPSAPVDKERWVLVDQTCQVMFVGAGTTTLQFVFPTSTGEPGYETRLQDRTMVYRYDPATENGGWHNSTDFPVPEDNPLNGNMYKPLYFDGGLAIHGANNVPTSPQSKGCPRLRLADHDQLLAWLGIADVTTPIGGSRFGLAVSIQGQYVPAP